MTIRLYISPLERVDNARGPKYLVWRLDPDPADNVDVTAWTLIDYGQFDRAIIAIEAEDAAHAALAAKSDVQQIPADLDTNVGNANRETVRSALEAMALPGQWVQNGTPWREVVRTVCGFMLFAQRYDGLRQAAQPGAPALGSQLDGNLSVQWQNIPQATRDAVLTTGASFGYDMTFITGTTVVRQILKTIADLWGQRPVLFGLGNFNGGTPFTV